MYCGHCVRWGRNAEKASSPSVCRSRDEFCMDLFCVLHDFLFFRRAGGNFSLGHQYHVSTSYPTGSMSEPARQVAQNLRILFDVSFHVEIYITRPLPSLQQWPPSTALHPRPSPAVRGCSGALLSASSAWRQGSSSLSTAVRSPRRT